MSHSLLSTPSTLSTPPRALRAELEQLLAEPIAEAKARASSSFDLLAGSGERDLILYGAGSLGTKVAEHLSRLGRAPRAFLDGNQAKWGGRIAGTEVTSVSDAVRRFPQAVCVVTVCSPGNSYLAIREQLLNAGLSHVIPSLPLLWKYAEDLLPHAMIQLPCHTLAEKAEVLAAYDLMADEASRGQYIAEIRFRLWADYSTLPSPSPEDQHFPPVLVSLGLEEVFVDCGAYTGDTLSRFLELTGASCGRALAFEPDPKNFRGLESYVRSLSDELRSRVEIVNAAVGGHTGPAEFAASGAENATLIVGKDSCPRRGRGLPSSTSHPNKGSIPVPCFRLDDYLHDMEPTLLKLDVEGAELAALHGAQNTIARLAPVIMACAYHRPDDLWTIPLFLHSLQADYGFYLRSHSHDAWETVIYALPRSRRARAKE